jgi:hypothetical protein
MRLSLSRVALPILILARHCQLPRLRLPEAVPPPLRKLLFIYQSSLEDEERDRYSRLVVATYLCGSPPPLSCSVFLNRMLALEPWPCIYINSIHTLHAVRVYLNPRVTLISRCQYQLLHWIPSCAFLPCLSLRGPSSAISPV